ERAGVPSVESSDVMNNVGTGNEVLCELNYTPEEADGTINESKALEIYNQFQVSKQLCSHLVESGDIEHPSEFIKPLPHISFVQSEKNIEFLTKRYEKLQYVTAFQWMSFSEDVMVIVSWLQLIMKDRDLSGETFVATKVDGGTDVNFGELAKNMIRALDKSANVNVNF